jgi:DNA repair protein RAD50
VQTEVENSRQAVQTAKLAARDLQTLKSAALIVSRTVNEIKDLQIDIQRLERDLKSSGSLKTVEEVQREADGISTEM